MHGAELGNYPAGVTNWCQVEYSRKLMWPITLYILWRRRPFVFSVPFVFSTRTVLLHTCPLHARFCKRDLQDIGGAAEADGSGAFVPRVHQEVLVVREQIRLVRKIPSGAGGAIVRATTDASRASVIILEFVGILPDVT